MKRTRCIFCSSTAERGKEHVFANTLLKSLNAGRSELLLEKRASADDSLEVSRRHTYDSFKSGGVCKNCNAGWMSVLESRVAPWILGVQVKADLARFQEDDRRPVFACWALKTACVIDQVGGMGDIGPEIPVRLFKQRDSLPDNIYVLIGFLDWPDSTLFTFNQRNRWTGYPLHVQCPEPDCDSNGRFFKVAFALNRLMVLVAGVPSPHFHLVIGTGVHVPIWPERTIQLNHWFHPLRTVGVDPETALRNFSDLVAAAHAGRMS